MLKKAREFCTKAVRRWRCGIPWGHSYFENVEWRAEGMFCPRCGWRWSASAIERKMGWGSGSWRRLIATRKIVDEFAEAYGEFVKACDEFVGVYGVNK